MSGYDMIRQYQEQASAEREQREVEKAFPTLKLQDGDKAVIRFISNEPGIVYFEQNRYPAQNTRYRKFTDAPTGQGLKKPALTAEYAVVVVDFIPGPGKVKWMKEQSAKNVAEGKKPLDVKEYVAKMIGKVHRLVLKSDNVIAVADKHDERNGLVQHVWKYARRGAGTDTKYELEYWETPEPKKDKQLKEFQKLERPNFEQIVFGRDNASDSDHADDVAKEQAAHEGAVGEDDDEEAPF